MILVRSAQAAHMVGQKHNVTDFRRKPNLFEKILLQSLFACQVSAENLYAPTTFITLYNDPQMLSGDALFKLHWAVKLNARIAKFNFHSSLVLHLQLM